MSSLERINRELEHHKGPDAVPYIRQLHRHGEESLGVAASLLSDRRANMFFVGVVVEELAELAELGIKAAARALFNDCFAHQNPAVRQNAQRIVLKLLNGPNGEKYFALLIEAFTMEKKHQNAALYHTNAGAVLSKMEDQERAVAEVMKLMGEYAQSNGVIGMTNEQLLSCIRILHNTSCSESIPMLQSIINSGSLGRIDEEGNRVPAYSKEVVVEAQKASRTILDALGKEDGKRSARCFARACSEARIQGKRGCEQELAQRKNRGHGAARGFMPVPSNLFPAQAVKLTPPRRMLRVVERGERFGGSMRVR